MIFEYTTQERIQIGEVADSIIAAELEDLQTIKTAKSDKSKKAAKDKYNKNTKERDLLFSHTLQEIEEKRLALLMDPAAILEEAKKQAADFIYFAYVFICANLPEKDRKPGKCSIVGINDLFIGWTKWDYEAEIQAQKEKAFVPEESPIIFEEKALVDYIEKNVLRLYFDKLGADPEGKKLQDSIKDIVKTSPYVYRPETETTPIKKDSKPKLVKEPLADIKVFGIMNDKSTATLIQDNGIFSQEANGQMLFSFNQAPNGKQVPVYMSLSFDDITGLSKKLNAYDLAVYNAISDIYFYCKQGAPDIMPQITINEIWRRMNGKQGRDTDIRPTGSQRQRIKKSIDKMRHIDFYMDLKEEFLANYITQEDFGADDRLTGYYIKDYLLACAEGGRINTRGRHVEGYIFYKEPILYTYNRAKKHLLFVPFALLDTSDKISDSENVTEFKMYLLQQTKLMKERKRNSTRILLSTIYTATGIQPPEERLAGKDFENETTQQAVLRRYRKADRGKIEGILDAWTKTTVEGKAWLKGYTPINKNGDPATGTQPVVGYDIIL